MYCQWGSNWTECWQSFHLSGCQEGIFNQLPFALVVSQDVFQKQLDASFEGLTGITGIADDTGSTEEEHDRNLVNLMQRAREEVQTDRFFWHTWTLEGVKPNNKKISAILDMEPPPYVKTLESLLNYPAHLILQQTCNTDCSTMIPDKERHSLLMGTQAWPCIQWCKLRGINAWYTQVLWTQSRNCNTDRCILTGLGVKLLQDG